MFNTLKNHYQGCKFLFLEGELAKIGSELSDRFDITTAKKPAQLTSAIHQALLNEKRIIMVCEESNLKEQLQKIRQSLTPEERLHVGFLLIAENPENYLNEYCKQAEIIDIIPINDFKKSPDFFLGKAAQLLVRKEEREYGKIGQKMLERLNRIFIRLSSEKEPKQLLSLILGEAIDLTNAERGVFYLVKEEDGEMFMNLKISKVHQEGRLAEVETVNIKAAENSLCGYVVLTGRPLNIGDLEELNNKPHPQWDREVDFGKPETTECVLTVPFVNNRNEILAILQLANKREGNSPHFDSEDESLLASLGTQSSICLENVELYSDIHNLFNGFVKASITAIEARDPSTGGHSERVAKMTVSLADAVSRCETGIYRSVVFKTEEIRELEYAALLHDFGKIGVREEVLVKAKKLYPWQLERVNERLKICKAAVKINLLEKQVSGKMTATQVEQSFKERLEILDEYWRIIEEANQPTVLKQEVVETLGKIRSEKLVLPDGMEVDLLTEEELSALSISKGSLTHNERLEVESHVRHTYQFLKMIPWTRTFKNLSEIAYCHHEKLDGSGYPRGLKAHEIPLQSKIMTIADIFDALTAADRWYKDAVPTEKALQILAHEVDAGMLDPVLYEIFLASKIYSVNKNNLKKKVS